MAAKPKALVAKKGGQQIILVVPKELKTCIGNSEDKIEAENRSQQGATNPFAEDHSNPPPLPVQTTSTGEQASCNCTEYEQP